MTNLAPLQSHLHLIASQLTDPVNDAPTRSLGLLDRLTTVTEQLELTRAALVAKARREGASWTQIGQQLGMTKQAAQQRYGAKPSTKVDDPDQMKIADVD